MASRRDDNSHPGKQLDKPRDYEFYSDSDYSPFSEDAEREDLGDKEDGLNDDVQSDSGLGDNDQTSRNARGESLMQKQGREQRCTVFGFITKAILHTRKMRNLSRVAGGETMVLLSGLVFSVADFEVVFESNIAFLDRWDRYDI